MLLASLLAFFVVVFLVATLTAAIAWLGFLKKQSEAREPSDTIPNSLQPADDGGTRLLREEHLSTVTFWDHFLARFDFVGILKTRLMQADLTWSVGRATMAMLLLGTVSFVIANQFLPVFASLVIAAIATFAPYGYILHLRTKRFEKFREAFPDVLDSLSRAMRAGSPFSASMEAVMDETPPVVASELRRASIEANLGLGWQRALENLGQRVPMLEVNLFVAAVQLHSRTGGKLSEVLGGLAENMREEGALRGEVRAMAAYGKLSGLILTILPVGIAAMMMLVNPSYMVTLWEHPMGKNLIAAAGVCLLLAHLVIQKIVDIEI
jgi:tight adherence protein B